MFIQHYVSRVSCHLSHVTCHVSPVMCHLPCVTCHLSHKRKINFFYLKKKKKTSFKKIGQCGGASQGRVCYQRGLPRLVLKTVEILLGRDTIDPDSILPEKGLGKGDKSFFEVQYLSKKSSKTLTGSKVDF